MNRNKLRIRAVLALFVILSLAGGSCQMAARAVQTPTASGKMETAVAAGVATVVATAAAQAAATATAPGLPAQPTSVPPTQAAQVEPTPERAAGAVPVFASYKEPETSKQAALQPYTVAPDLSNVVNPFILSKAQVERLGKDGFVVSPGNEKEFFTVYEKARYANVPIFVTSDSLLHAYHLLFDKVLRTTETQHFIPLL